MYILANMWFTKLIKQFFFWIDKIVFNFIPTIYDLLISIARTSVLTQSDIAEVADRLYKLLAIFMIFKVTLSLITYVVNPDDLIDKSKGVSKLGTNIILSLALLILTPYLFNYAYQIQTIILEDNSLVALVFGEEKSGQQSFFNSAGDDMAFTTMSAFLTPNTSLDGMHECIMLIDSEKFNESCKSALESFTQNNPNFSTTTLNNYVAGVENSSLGLMFRQDLVLATDDTNSNFIMDYKFIFSTIVGVVVILLLITFCMDIAVRSVKLAFLQLIAPIPIISYIDPKSGKDGMFKKWYQTCFKTYTSLFVRLLALYFAVYIISKVADMKLVDIIDGSYQTNCLVAIFIIIGALMFAKDFPKILEGLGVKLDGGGKFYLNPLKKFEEQAMAGKNITGAARGALVGTAGALTGAGIGRGLSGAWRGMKSGKGWAETGKAEAEMNRKMRQAKLDGSTFLGRMGARVSGATGGISRGEMIAREKSKLETEQKQYDDRIKSIEDKIKPTKEKIADQKRFSDSIKAMEDRAKSEIEAGNGGAIGLEYLSRKAEYERLKSTPGSSAAAIATAQKNMIDYLNVEGMKEYMTEASAGRLSDSTFENLRKNAEQAGRSVGTILSTDGDDIHKQYGASKGETGNLERSIYDQEREISELNVKKADLGDKMRDISDRERKAKADESVAK